MLSRGGTAVALTTDHTCGDRAESERVKRAGGNVDCENYVGGLVAVSRAFGDFDPDSQDKVKGLTAEPGA